jgi:DNA-binding transcriptional ArsR family regulator
MTENSGIDQSAIRMLAALAQDRRLRVFRLLMHYSGGELKAGDIAERLDIQPSNLSFHLAHLERTGLIRARRDRRNMFYSVNLDRVRELMRFLVQDCCAGDPSICDFDLAGIPGADPA